MWVNGVKPRLGAFWCVLVLAATSACQPQRVAHLLTATPSPTGQVLAASATPLAKVHRSPTAFQVVPVTPDVQHTPAVVVVSQISTPTNIVAPETVTATPGTVWAVTPDAQASSREIRAPILMYHHIRNLAADANSLERGLTVEPAVFRQQLALLRFWGYTPINLYALQSALTTGAPLPAKPIVLTFDDGYRDNYEVLFPLMQEFGFTGTLFLTTQFMDEGRPEYMTWAMAQEMATAGWDLEPHTKTHASMAGQPKPFVIYEILGSKQTVEYYTGRSTYFFAYPGGDYDAQAQQVLRDLGFWGAVTTDFARTHTLQNPYIYGRVRINGGETLLDFSQRLAENLPKDTPTP